MIARPSKTTARIGRRTFLLTAHALAMGSSTLPFRDARAQQGDSSKTLGNASIELGGEWQGSRPDSAHRVMARMRAACLSGMRLLSDQQPESIRIDNRPVGPPSIWLHDDRPTTAWIFVNVGPRDWCKLAYQFGHELGHVLCNSWKRTAIPSPPSQWLEEALVEAFSIRGLGLLADSWQQTPPFPGDERFAGAIRQYRDDVLKGYRAPDLDLAQWFRVNRIELEKGQLHIAGLAVLNLLPILEMDLACLEDLGALNRWPERTRLPVNAYLARWRRSCGEIGTSGRLPAQLEERLALYR